MKLYPHQQQFVDLDDNRTVAIWSRQQGKTTAMAAKIVKLAKERKCHQIVISPHHKASMVTKWMVDVYVQEKYKEKASIKRFWAWLRGKRPNTMMTVLTFGNGSTVHYMGATDIALRGFHPDHMHVDNWNEFMPPVFHPLLPVPKDKLTVYADWNADTYKATEYWRAQNFTIHWHNNRIEKNSD